MKLIKQTFEILDQQPGIEGMYKQIELAGRTCYKSEDKITEDSAKEFVDRMINSGHWAMLEHGTVYLRIPIKDSTAYRIDSYVNNPYSITKIGNINENCYVNEVFPGPITMYGSEIYENILSEKIMLKKKKLEKIYKVSNAESDTNFKIF